jgi:hypothetical protein
MGYNIGEDEGEHESDDGDFPDIYSYLFEVRLSARWFPLRKHTNVIKPYAGFGVGYFDFSQDHYYNYYDDDWHYYDDDHHSETIASGVFPFFSAGFYLPVGNGFNNKMDTVLQFEYRNDFNKEDNGIDLSNQQFTIGFGIMWK